MENKVLAVVNGREVTETDLQFLVQSMGQNARQFQGPEGRKQLIEELIMQELLYTEALEKGLDKEEGYLKAVRHMQSTLLKQYALNQLLSNLTVTDEEGEAYFNLHSETFKKPASAIASHILVATEEEAQKIKAEIDNGLDFADAAQKYSSCPSKEVGGALGEFTQGKMVPEFEQVAFTMPEGSISEPVKTQFGYHLIYLMKRTDAHIPTYSEVADQVKQYCLSVKQNETYVNKSDELKAKYDVVRMAD
jgi:peptidyl-prolyl cis-trans isomerase C